MTKEQFITKTFGKSSFIMQYRMRYAIQISLNAKDLTINHTMVVYGNRQKRMSKQLRFVASIESFNGKQA